MSLPERIATLALNTFNSLPARCKPRIHPDGRREWTPMSAIVLATHRSTSNSNSTTIDDNVQSDPEEIHLSCVSLATGTKCLPATLIAQCKGQILHDSHAEILALRGLNRWLLNEMALLVRDEAYVSPVLARRRSLVDHEIDTWSPPPFEIRAGVAVYMFSTTAPCGDASMELLMRGCVDPTPWEDGVGTLLVAEASQPTGTDVVDVVGAAQIQRVAEPLGRGYFSRLGTMRRKPARGDAPITMSKSCSDKLALKQFTGILGFPVDSLVSSANGEGVFLKGLVVYEDQFDAVGYQRAFGKGGRLAIVATEDEYEKGKFFDVHVLPTEFARFDFEKKLAVDTAAGGDSSGSKATNITAVYVAGSGNGTGLGSTPPVHEVLVGGVKQGFKQIADKLAKGSVLCRKNMVESAVDIWKAFRKGRSFALHERNMKYSDMKDAVANSGKRHKIKRDAVGKLGGWISNSKEDDFNVWSKVVCIDSAVNHQ